MIIRWRRGVIGGVFVAIGVLVVGLSVVLGPVVRDDLVLDRQVRAVVLDWRDFGEQRARARLQYELDHRHIGRGVGDDACRFERSGEGGRRVSCRWRVEIPVPYTGWALPLSFSSEAAVDAGGRLR